MIPAGIPHGKTITAPVSAIQGTNDAGEVGYTGPCPLPGQMQRYLFRVYGLDDFLHSTGGQTSMTPRGDARPYPPVRGDRMCCHPMKFSRQAAFITRFISQSVLHGTERRLRYGRAQSQNFRQGPAE